LGPAALPAYRAALARVELGGPALAALARLWFGPPAARDKLPIPPPALADLRGGVRGRMGKVGGEGVGALREGVGRSLVPGLPAVEAFTALARDIAGRRRKWYHGFLRRR